MASSSTTTPLATEIPSISQQQEADEIETSSLSQQMEVVEIEMPSLSQHQEADEIEMPSLSQQQEVVEIETEMPSSSQQEVVEIVTQKRRPPHVPPLRPKRRLKLPNRRVLGKTSISKASVGPTGIPNRRLNLLQEMASSSTTTPWVIDRPSLSQQEAVEKVTEMPSSSQQEVVEIVTQIPPVQPVPPLRPNRRLNLPNRQLLENQNREEGYLRICVPLYKASITGDWATARRLIIDDYFHMDLTGCSITRNNETALHVAVCPKSTKLTESFVKNLVDNMTDEQLKFHNQSGITALGLAAIAGNVTIARILVTRCRDLLNIPCGNGNVLPLYFAAFHGRYDMVNYLYGESEDLKDNFWNNEHCGWLLLKCLEADMYDIAEKILKGRPLLTVTPGVLEVLASKPNAFRDIEDKMIQRVIRAIRQCTHVVEKERHATLVLRMLLATIIRMHTDEIDKIIRGPPDSEPKGKQKTTSQVGEKGGPPDSEPKGKQKTTSQVGEKGRLRDALLKSIQETISPVGDLRNYQAVLFIAAEMGNTKFIVEVLRLYPELIWHVNHNLQSIFHVAVLHRQEGVYNLLYETGMMDLITSREDVDGNNMLHLAAMNITKIKRLEKISRVALQKQREAAMNIENNRLEEFSGVALQMQMEAAMNIKNKRLQEISGVALQMQRELLWYKEVEGILPPSYQEKMNNAGLLPRELFTQDHKDLMSASEKWMKDTASHCMVVSALIATIVFAAAFTVPGGYKQDTGVPVFLHHKAFIVFAISDAISLIFATSSILMFLYILTSRYAEEDFLESLPEKLMRGLAALFLSIFAMMVAFSASFFVLYHNKLIWVPYVITVFCSLPVILYARHEYDLLMDVYNSTYRSKDLFKPKKPMLY